MASYEVIIYEGIYYIDADDAEHAANISGLTNGFPQLIIVNDYEFNRQRDIDGNITYRVNPFPSNKRFDAPS